MLAPSTVTMFNIFKEEKQRMNPIRRTINYVVVPIILAITVAIIITMIVLMSIDEDKYLIEFLVLFGALIIILVAMLISVPFTRKKEVAIELQKYDLDINTAEKRDEYVFVQNNLVATYPLTSSPFEDFKSVNTTFSGTYGLRELLDYYGVSAENAKLHNSVLEPSAISVADYTNDARYTNFYADTQDSMQLKIYGSHTVVINQNGISVNGTQFSFQTAHVEIITYNLLMQVNIYLNFLFEAEELTVSLRLDKNVLAIINNFSIAVKNKELLDFILNNKSVAFKEILKRGSITEKQINKLLR